MFVRKKIQIGFWKVCNRFWFPTNISLTIFIFVFEKKNLNAFLFSRKKKSRFWKVSNQFQLLTGSSLPVFVFVFEKKKNF